MQANLYLCHNLWDGQVVVRWDVRFDCIIRTARSVGQHLTNYREFSGIRKWYPITVGLTVFQLRTDPSRDSIPQPSNQLITALLRTLKTASNCKHLYIFSEALDSLRRPNTLKEITSQSD